MLRPCEFEEEEQDIAEKKPGKCRTCRGSLEDCTTRERHPLFLPSPTGWKEMTDAGLLGADVEGLLLDSKNQERLCM